MKSSKGRITSAVARLRPVRLRPVRLRDRLNRLMQYFHGIFQDVTERRKEEVETLHSHERLRAHLENTPLGVIEWDLQFRVITWNARCEEILGYTREEAMGRHAAELIVSGELYDVISELFLELLSQTDGTHSTTENVTKDGRNITCDWYTTTLLGADGKPVGVASICQDITERERLEKQLVQSQKMEAIGTLAGGVAHDMNNVLAVVLGLGSVIEETLPGACVSKQQTSSAADRLSF